MGEGYQPSPWLGPRGGYEYFADRDDGTWAQMMRMGGSGLGLFVATVSYNVKYSNKWHLRVGNIPWLMPAVVRWHSHASCEKTWFDGTDGDFFHGPPVHIEWGEGVWADTVDFYGLGLENPSEATAQFSNLGNPVEMKGELAWGDYVDEGICVAAAPWQLVPIESEYAERISQYIIMQSDRLKLYHLGFDRHWLDENVLEDPELDGEVQPEEWNEEEKGPWDPTPSLPDRQWECHCQREVSLTEWNYWYVTAECQRRGEDCPCDYTFGMFGCACGAPEPTLFHYRYALLDLIETGGLTGHDLLPSDIGELWDYAVERYLEGSQTLHDLVLRDDLPEGTRECFTSSWRQVSPYSDSSSLEEHRMALFQHSTSSESSQGYSAAS